MITNNIHEAIFSVDLNSQTTIFDYISNGILITDEHSIILYTNPAFTKIREYSKEELKGGNPGLLHSGQHDKIFYQEMWKQLTEHGFWEGEIWNRRKSGQIFPELLTISKVAQSGAERFYYIAVSSDISFLKKDINKKLHLAFYDPLTTLPNRNLYFDRVNYVVDSIKDDKKKSAVIFYMDLDKFKQVNDTYGHCVGDKLLKNVGERLTSMVRSGDIIARIGGDEFSVIITSTSDKDSVVNFAKRILKVIEEPFHIDDHLISISISIGISFYPNDTNDVETLLTYADRAMYDAKKSGKKIVRYDLLPKM